jgi:threonine/homoserine/homoserine lactone efflux protein
MAISVSVGPIALITMKRTAEFGLRAGIISAIAIALIDTTVAILILLGVHHSLKSLIHIPRGLHLLLTIAILIYGLYLFTKKVRIEKNKDYPVKKHFWDTILLCFANPSTYISFSVIAILMTRFLGSSLFNRLEVIIGFFIGAIFWWLSLVHISFNNRSRLSIGQLQRGVGLLIMFLAIISLLTPGRFEHLSIIRMFS